MLQRCSAILDHVCSPNGQPSTTMRSVAQALNCPCLSFLDGLIANAVKHVHGQQWPAGCLTQVRR